MRLRPLFSYGGDFGMFFDPRSGLRIDEARHLVKGVINGVEMFDFTGNIALLDD